MKTKDGVLTAEVSTFSELFEFGRFFHESPSAYYYRGHGDARWGLQTTMERFQSQLNDYITGARETLLLEFKRLLRGKGLLHIMNISSDEEIFALGQHHGLPTPFLDWSESFYIALFFAVADEMPADVEKFAVWGIQTSAKEAMDDFNKKAEKLFDEVGGKKSLAMKFVDPYTDVNSRLISQSGVFLQKPEGFDIENVISDFCAGNDHSPVLVKISIPVSEREKIIDNLFAMNINWATIYPGVEGAAKHVRMKMQMLDLKVRRMGKEAAFKHADKKIFGRSENRGL